MLQLVTQFASSTSRARKQTTQTNHKHTHTLLHTRNSKYSSAYTYIRAHTCAPRTHARRARTQPAPAFNTTVNTFVRVQHLGKHSTTHSHQNCHPHHSHHTTTFTSRYLTNIHKEFASTSPSNLHKPIHFSNPETHFTPTLGKHSTTHSHQHPHHSSHHTTAFTSTSSTNITQRIHVHIPNTHTYTSPFTSPRHTPSRRSPQQTNTNPFTPHLETTHIPRQRSPQTTKPQPNHIIILNKKTQRLALETALLRALWLVVHTKGSQSSSKRRMHSSSHKSRFEAHRRFSRWCECSL
jgi:hypothetical protein